MGGRGRRHEGPLRKQILKLVDEAVCSGARIEKATKVIGISARTLERWARCPESSDQRKGPTSAPKSRLSAQEEASLLRLLTLPEYRNLSPEQVVAKAADQGVYIASERTMRRLLKRNKLNTYRERSKPASQTKPRQCTAKAALQVLSWDITYLRHGTIRGAYFYLYMFVDIWSRRILGAEVHEVQSAELAAKLLTTVCAEHRIEANAAAVLHSDNGAPMKGATMLVTMQALGIIKSFSRPGVSDDNPFIESLFRHLKYAPSYPSKGFCDLQEARSWVTRFVDWYNNQHLHSAIGFVTPAQRHDGSDVAILEARRRLYESARAANPARWSRPPRSWERPSEVILNPERVIESTPRSAPFAA